MGRGRDRGSQRGSSLGHEEMGAKGVREETLAGGHEVAIRGLGALWRHISNTPRYGRWASFEIATEDNVVTEERGGGQATDKGAQ